jgi:hypothetical protein
MSAVPTPYAPSFSFYDWNQNNPNIPAPGQKWDIEYTNIQTLTDAILARLALITQDDGRIKAGTIGRDQLAAGLATGVGAPLPWQSFQNYTTADAVIYNGSWYWCLTDHASSGGFDPSKWQYVGTFFSDDPYLLALGQDSLVNGILSADTAGRLKMADNFVTAAKLDGPLRNGLAKGWANFDPRPNTLAVTLSYVGNIVSATGTFPAGFTIGSTITFRDEVGNNAILNGSWGVLTVVGSTVTFDLGAPPAGGLAGTTAQVVKVNTKYNIKTITFLAAGRFAVAFTSPLTYSRYTLSGSVVSNFSEVDCRRAADDPAEKSQGFPD